MPLALLLLMLASQDASQIERTVTLRLAEEPRPAPPSTAQHELQSATDQRAAPLTLEWLIEKKNGGLERAVIRTFATGTPSLSVPTGDGTRVLRVHRSGAAPVSILIEPTTRAQTYDVPPPQAGGEIFGRVLSSGVLRPEVMLLNANGNNGGNGNGHGNGFIDKAPIDSRGYFRFGAIAKAGAYSLTPVYKGPVTGSAIPVDRDTHSHHRRLTVEPATNWWPVSLH